MGYVIQTTPIRVYSVTPKLALHICYRHIKFGDSWFSHSRDMTAGLKIENGTCDHDHTPFMCSLLPMS